MVDDLREVRRIFNRNSSSKNRQNKLDQSLDFKEFKDGFNKELLNFWKTLYETDDE